MIVQNALLTAKLPKTLKNQLFKEAKERKISTSELLRRILFDTIVLKK